MKVIGLNAFHGDSSACLFVDGIMVAAAEEERFRRVKHWAGFPSNSIQYCLESQNIDLSEIDVIAINSDSKAARVKKIHYLLSGQASWALIREKLNVRQKRKSLEAFLAEAFVGKKFNELIENSKLHFVEKCGHAPMMECPDIFNEHLRKFLVEVCTKEGEVSG